MPAELLFTHYCILRLLLPLMSSLMLLLSLRQLCHTLLVLPLHVTFRYAYYAAAASHLDFCRFTIDITIR